MIQIKKTQPGIVWVTHPPDYCVALSVAELATLLDVSEQTVNRWCRGAEIPRVAKIAMESAVIGLIHCEGWQGAHFSLDRDGVGRFYLDTAKKGFTCMELENWSLVYQHRDTLTRELGELRGQLAVIQRERIEAPACRFSPLRSGRRPPPSRPRHLSRSA